jgi:hypothetical protein
VFQLPSSDVVDCGYHHARYEETALDVVSSHVVGVHSKDRDERCGFEAYLGFEEYPNGLGLASQTSKGDGPGRQRETVRQGSSG